MAFTDCASGVLVVDDFPYADEFEFEAPFELIMDEISLYDGLQRKLWWNAWHQGLHMDASNILKLNFADGSIACPP